MNGATGEPVATELVELLRRLLAALAAAPGRPHRIRIGRGGYEVEVEWEAAGAPPAVNGAVNGTANGTANGAVNGSANGSAERETGPVGRHRRADDALAVPDGAAAWAR